ncbi:MAG: protein kinase [Anaerolineae bacterium]|nr:protein kinase [Anaerolineae bacterium]MDW8097981.1 protein kinase [Anaerolineae bacterium]
MLWNCPKCGAEQPQEANFCISCGMPLRTYCPRCDTPIRAGARRCGRCGTPLADPLSFSELFEIPTILQGRYEIEQRLKRGYTTAVYLARDLRLGRHCIVKEFNPRRLVDELERDEAQRSFQAEVARWAQIHHPNLARIQGMFIQADHPYLVMEWVRGRSLRHLITDPSVEIREADAVAWVLQICEALAVLHAQNPPLIFGDLNPGHVMITADGQVKLIDFGLSAWFTPWDRGIPRYRGSPGYAAPEQRERWEADARSDLYALGGLLYYALTRQAPNQPPIRLNELSPALAEVVRQARQRDPERRFSSAQAMQEALARAVHLPSHKPAVIQASSGRVAEQPTPDPWSALRAQLREQANADWLRTVRRFYGGQILDWLRREAHRLGKEGQTQAVRQVEAAVAEAESLLAQGELEDALGRQVIVARWLTRIGAGSASPELSLQPQRLAFGELTRRVVKRAVLRLRNTGPTMLVGEVQSLAPWLEVRDARFACGPDEEARVTVVALGKRLPSENVRAVRALHVITNRGEVWMPASASLVVPKLAISPEALDFGQVVHGQTADAELIVANQGGGEVEGTIQSAVPWLSVMPDRFHVPSRERQTIRVRFHGGLAPMEMQGAADVLLVNSDDGRVKLPVRWRWAEPGLMLTPTVLLWGEQRREAQPEMSLTITNSGTAVLEGAVRSRCSWVHVTPEAFTCPPGRSVTIAVRATLGELPPGRTSVGEALVIESNAGRRTVSASVDILAPELQVKPPSLDLGEVMWGEASQAALRIANRGSLPLMAQLESLFPWLHVEPAEVVCPPGALTRVKVEARTEEMLHGGEWHAVPGIRVESNAGRREIPISLLVRKPELQLTPEFLDFGVIPRQGVGQTMLFISNPGTAPLTWSLSSDALWLEVPTSQGITNPGETSQVHLYAYGLAVPADQDEAQMSLIIESDVGEQVVHGIVMIARPQLWVDPLRLDLGISANYAPVEGLLSLFNRGLGDLTGTVQTTVPWLTVEPVEFQVPTGGQQPILVRAIPDGLREGETLVEGALEVVSNAGRERVDVRLEIRLSGELVIEPQGLLWRQGEMAPVLRLRNVGRAPISVLIRPQASWLHVNHQVLMIKPGRIATVQFTLDEAILPSAPIVETELVLDWAGQIVRIPVVVETYAFVARLRPDDASISSIEN